MEPRKLALVIEDDPAIVEIVRSRLRLCGFTEDDQVIVATNGAAGIQAVDSHEPDIVLLDQRLPRGAGAMKALDQVGQELLRYIVRRRPNSPVIVMTAHFGATSSAAAATTASFMKAGARDFITKPLDESPEPLEAKICALLAAPRQAPAPVPAAPAEVQRYAIRFADEDRVVEIDGLPARGEIVPVLRVLRDVFLEDQRAKRRPEAYRSLRGAEIAKQIGLSEADDVVVRQRVKTFRKRFESDYETARGIKIAPDAIIQSMAGYRLNPSTVALVA